MSHPSCDELGPLTTHLAALSMQSAVDLACPPTLATTLAFDVLSVIFRLVVGTVWWTESAVPYLKALFRLAHVNSHWRDCCFSSAPLWASMKITRQSVPEFLAFSLSASASTPLHLHLDLFHAGRHTVDDILGFLSHHLDRVETLYLLVGSAETATDLVRHFNRAALPALRSLRIECGPRQMKRTGSPSFALLDVGAKLVALRIRRVRFSLDHLPDFSCLRYIVFRDIVIRCAPSFAVWSLIQQTAVRLERIAIQNVGCRVVPNHPPPLLFSSVTHLDIAFTDRTAGLAALVGCMRTPNLSFLSVTGQTSALLNCILQSSNNVSGLRNLVIGFPESMDVDLVQIFRSAPLLKTLDARCADIQVMRVLNGYSSAHGIMCPYLEVIMLSTAGPTPVRRFLEQRISLPGFALQQVIFRHNLTAGSYDEEDLEWFDKKARVGMGVGFRDLTWLFTDQFVGLADYTA
ncbi:hypothetical protein C8R46DRAFT_1209881 [Mycena filopes]|nr:hypothetical protein C8R46DRAFT_1209881 [Mycena filopes]